MNKIFFQKKLRRLKRKISDLFWQIDQKIQRERLKRMPPSELAKIKQDLAETGRRNIPGCQITVSFGSRQFGNRDNILDRCFCRSFLRMTEKPQAIEIIVKIDEDDGLLFYHKIMKKYEERINFRFIVSGRGRGYADMHIWHANAVKYRSRSSIAFLILTEDTELSFKHWDTMLLDKIKNCPHNFFISTPCPLEEAIRLIGPNPAEPVPVYWLVGAEFPVVGFNLLTCTERVARRYPGWTGWGNQLLIDNFSGDLLKGLWNKYQTNVHFETPIFAIRRGIFSWTDSVERSNVRNNTLLEFFKPENQKIRDEMVDEIIRAYKEKTSMPRENNISAKR